jgi:predicted DNA-binding transcriptional regulator YafY
MRADRLLSIMMILQARGRVTARALAEELEVSERTIYRDMDALGAAGVPVYAEQGQGGGYALAERFRTDLTGLNEEETRALFMLSIPTPLLELGVSQELKAALLKLSASLPAARRLDEAWVRRRIHLDSEAWFQPREPVPYLGIVHRAVWQDRRLHVTYRLPFGTESGGLVDPYGLVAKTNAWYLVYALEGRIRARRVSDILDARLAEATFVRPVDFDLVSFWRDWCAEVEKKHVSYPVTIRAEREHLGGYLNFFGPDIRRALGRAGPPDDRGRVRFTLYFENLEGAREHLLGFGRALEVLKPHALRVSILDHAQQVVELYEKVD